MEKSTKNILAIAIIVVLVIIVLAFIWMYFPKNDDPQITTFEECVAAGYPVMESYPRRCSFNGMIFIEEINEARYCTSESRNAEVCTAIYKPVCGWFDPEEVQCIRYPCAQTYSNSCLACINENVQYWTEGECPD